MPPSYPYVACTPAEVALYGQLTNAECQAWAALAYPGAAYDDTFGPPGSGTGMCAWTDAPLPFGTVTFYFIS